MQRGLVGSEMCIRDRVSTQSTWDPDKLLKCIDYNVMKEWEDIMVIERKIDWSILQDAMTGILIYLDPALKSIEMLTQCSQGEIQDFIEKAKKEMEHQGKFVQKIMQNIKTLISEMKLIVEQWNFSKFSELGTTTGEMIQFLFK
eukprot:TRINITY_DN10459_c0_g1_i5.p2 TRINITY_DN10459_c0_g1~~TRINITY_DN10459_c0_g1_i5.p2  ORF type:complete len:144 (+),score=38.51 TRINITY_DN10459_c0_g1_i5:173-604(+)